MNDIEKKTTSSKHLMTINPVNALYTYLVQYPQARKVVDVLLEVPQVWNEDQIVHFIHTKFPGAEVLNMKNHEYGSMFNTSDVTHGLPWDIWDLQGKYKVWYAGSFASFESMADVVDYNYKLVNNFLCK
jgi:hypothetical protein